MKGNLLFCLFALSAAGNAPAGGNHRDIALR
jgi:hypothetical protein